MNFTIHSRSFVTALSLVMISLLGLGVCTAYAEPVYNPLTGHYYERVDGSVTYGDAKAAARARSFHGFRGDLVDVNSQQEMDFVLNTLGGPVTLNLHWLGAVQAPGTLEPSGGWQWESGSTWAYTNWAPGEPNNFGNVEEDRIVLWANTGTWNDFPAARSATGYIVEYAPVTAVALTQEQHPQGYPLDCLQTEQMKLCFDSQYGGTPLYWFVDEQTIIDSRPGAGMNVVVESTQDSVEASPNGPMPTSIARINDSQSPTPNNYYCHQSRVEPPITHPWAVIEVACFGAWSWLSHDPTDDSVPVLAGNAPQEGWATLYHPRGLPDSVFTGSGTPIFFYGLPGQTSGILMAGNEMKPVARERELHDPQWNRRQAEVKDGRVAVKFRVSLAEASPDAFASLLFRRNGPLHDGATAGDVYFSQGYSLSVDYHGVVRLVRSDGGGGFSTEWTSGGPVASNVRTPEGVQLEVRTDNGSPCTIEIWVDGVLMSSYCDRNPLLGPHVGLYAVTAPHTRVKFWERTVYDVGYEVVAKYTALPSGMFETDVTVRNALFASGTRLFSYAHMPVVFLNVGRNPGQFPWFNTAFLVQPNGRRTPIAESTGIYVIPVLDAPDSTRPAVWAGNAEGTQGIFCHPLYAATDGVPAAAPHMLLFYDPLPPSHWMPVADKEATLILAANPLPTEAYGTPLPLASFRFVAQWGPRVPAPVSVTDRR